MGIIVRQSVKTVFTSYTGVAIGILNTLVLYPLVLTQEELGLTRTLINAGVLLSTFAAFGAPQMPALFFPFFKDFQRRHGGFLFFLLQVGMLGFAVFVFGFFLFHGSIVSAYKESSPLLLHFMNWLIPLTFFLVFYNIFESYVIIHQHPVVPSFIREVLGRGFLSIGLVLVMVQTLSFEQFIPWVVWSYGALLAIIILYTRSKRILFLTPDLAVVRSDRFRPMMVFSAFILSANVSAAIIANIDGLMLSAYAGLQSTGIYSIAFFIAQIVEIPKRSLSQVLVPLVSEANKNNDVAMLGTLYKKSSINQFIIGGLIFLGIWLNIDGIFRFIPHGAEYAAGKWVVFYIGIAKLFDMVTGINAEIIGTSRYYRYDLVFYILLSIVGIGANMVLIPAFGFIGAAVASAFAVFLFNIARFFFVLRIFHIHPFAWSTLIVVGLGLGTMAVDSLVPHLGSVVGDIALRTVIILLIFIGGATALTVSQDFNDLVSRTLLRVRTAVRRP